MDYKCKSLFIVVLGGRTKKSHIELHDVRWVVGIDIEETYEQLRKEWFGDQKGLHIDSYIKIKYIDGYLINLIPKNQINNSLATLKSNPEHNLLWFVNIGGYSPKLMSEQHQFGLIAAKNYREAKKKAKDNWLINSLKKHSDDISKIRLIEDIDDCVSIEVVNGYQVDLVPDKYNRNQLFIPDWYGFKRIDKS